MKDNRSRFAIKLDAAQRYLMWHLLSDRIPLYLVTEYPKSGGSWFAQMLSAYLGVPFVRNKRPSLTKLRPMVLHGHHRYSSHFRNVFCVVRDGRDVMVSAYYHLLFHNDKNVGWYVDKMRTNMPFDDYDNVRGNLPDFIEYMFTKHDPSKQHGRWDKFVHSWLDKDAPVVRYEALLDNPAQTVGLAIEQALGLNPNIQNLTEIAEHFSFAKQANRKPGKEKSSSFLRKGIAGDWKNKFSRKASEVFDHYAGEALIELGYEQDHSWVKARPE